MNAATLTVQGEIAVLSISGSPDIGSLRQVLEEHCREAFAAPGRHRVEIRVPLGAPAVRTALHRTGFRFEGVRRGALALPGGGFTDQGQYARLRDDRTSGAEGFTALMNAALPRKRLIAHVLITDRAGRVCLLETTFKDDWELPGGIVEPLESPRQAAIREVIEELSIEVVPGPPLVIDWLAPHLGWEDAVEVIFAGPMLDEREKASLVPDPYEIRAIHWLTQDEAMPRLAAFARGRLASSIAALDSGQTYYLEAGSR